MLSPCLAGLGGTWGPPAQLASTAVPRPGSCFTRSLGKADPGPSCSLHSLLPASGLSRTCCTLGRAWLLRSPGEAAHAGRESQGPSLWGSSGTPTSWPTPVGALALPPHLPTLPAN